jgi:hypothetical protein
LVFQETKATKNYFGSEFVPVKIGDKPLKRLDSQKEGRLGFHSVGFGFRSRRTLILFRLVLISFRRVWKTFRPGARGSPVTGVAEKGA